MDLQILPTYIRTGQIVRIEDSIRLDKFQFEVKGIRTCEANKIEVCLRDGNSCRKFQVLRKPIGGFCTFTDRKFYLVGEGCNEEFCRVNKITEIT